MPLSRARETHALRSNSTGSHSFRCNARRSTRQSLMLRTRRSNRRSFSFFPSSAKPTRLRLIRLRFQHAAPLSASLDSGTGLAHCGTGRYPLVQSPGARRGSPGWRVDRFGTSVYGAHRKKRPGLTGWTAVASPCRSFLRSSSGRSPGACTRAAASRGPHSLRSRRARPHSTPLPAVSNRPPSAGTVDLS